MRIEELQTFMENPWNGERQNTSEANSTIGRLSFWFGWNIPCGMYAFSRVFRNWLKDW